MLLSEILQKLFVAMLNINRKENELNRSPHYDSKYTLRNPNFNDEMKREMIRDL